MSRRSPVVPLIVASVLAALTACGSSSSTATPSPPDSTSSSSASEGSPSGPPDGPTDLPPTPPSTPPQLEQVETAVSSNDVDQVTDDGTTKYALEMLQNADRVWSGWFKQVGFAEPFVRIELVQPGQPYTNTSCIVKTPTGDVTTFPTDFPNAFYCDVANGHGDDKGIIIIPVRALAKLWSGDIYGRKVDVKAIGDFAAGAIVSHEFGHHIGSELAKDKGINPQARGANKELVADCFAGVHAYALSLGTDGHLDPGDIDEALAALAALGDTGTSTDPHGTPDQRRDAFNLGFKGSALDPRGGVPNNCLKAFWPEAAFA